jgi:hypothetical protein
MTVEARVTFSLKLNPMPDRHLRSRRHSISTRARLCSSLEWVATPQLREALAASPSLKPYGRGINGRVWPAVGVLPESLECGSGAKFDQIIEETVANSRTFGLE